MEFAVTKPDFNVKPWFGSRGFTVEYARCDGATIQQVRDYAATVRSHRGWSTWFQVQPAAKTCSLHVFPMQEAATVFFRFANAHVR